MKFDGGGFFSKYIQKWDRVQFNFYFYLVGLDFFSQWFLGIPRLGAL
jgi:hypothetical protein